MSYRLHRVITKHIVETNPDWLYEEIGRPPITQIEVAVAKHIKSSDQDLATRLPAARGYDHDRITGSLDTVAQAIRDVAFLSYVCLQSREPDLVRSVRHKASEFIEGAVAFAKLPHATIGIQYQKLGELLLSGASPVYSLPAAVGRLREQHDSIEFGPGCPFANMRGGNGDPMFHDLTRWTVGIATRSFDDHPGRDPAFIIDQFQEEFRQDNEIGSS